MAVALIGAAGDLAAQGDSAAALRPSGPQRPADPQRGAATPQRASSAARPNRPSSRQEIVIPFTVGPGGCTDRARTYAVTMRIYNVLAQPVGIPTLAGADSASVPARAAGRPLSRLALPCGRYAAQWNGRHVTTGQRLAPGVYLYDLVIDGQRITRKVTLGS